MNFTRMITVSALLCFTFTAQAASTKHELILNTIEAVQPNERSADEVYINVTAYYADGKYDTYTIPGGEKTTFSDYAVRFPAGPPQQPQRYWLAKALPKIKNISLWKGEINHGQGVQLILSLIEHDVPPWNLDDLIGSVKIKLGTDAKGKATAEWALLSADAVSSQGKLKLGRDYILDISSKEGDYRVKLTLK